MQIGEVARQVRVNPRSIRYYKRSGLLPEPARTASGYRDYGPDDVDRIAFARRTTELDLHLDEIAEILALRDHGERPCDYVLEVARRRVDDLDERIQTVQRARDELASLIERAASPATLLLRTDRTPNDGRARDRLVTRSTPSTTGDPSSDRSRTLEGTVRAGGQTRDDAVWRYLEPIAGAPPLAGHLAFAWDAVDEWWEEAERIGVRPRDPYHRCGVVRSDRHVIVRADGRVVADSDQPTMLFETGLPSPFYLYENDVHLDRLEPSGTVTR